MRLFGSKYEGCHSMKEKVPSHRITSRDLGVGILAVSQALIGILGNLSLLYRYLLLYRSRGRLRDTDLIRSHLTTANSLFILSKGVPKAMAALGLKYSFRESGCRLLLYVQRVGRSVSTGTTCLLSVFQAVTISPRSSSWRNLGLQAPRCVSLSISLCWVLSMCVNFIFPAYVLYMSGLWESHGMVRDGDGGSCPPPEQEKVIGTVFALLIVVPELSLSLLIVWASGSMVLFLHRHRQRAQHLHSCRGSPGSSAESRATRHVLLLVGTFVCFHSLCSVLHACLALLHQPGWWMVNTTALVSACFPAISPFLLMSRNTTVSRLCSAWMRKRRVPNLTGIR
ncbi:vomeronasal type-1 receptor 4-like [Talpa occidentalis]|uniref:vomeronasal type-1 receptor 4-like n=1 Tax=Talpa occidentalis TaxID=50954 RepID=UPI00188F0066|nr:vomeronasal type-1 receptor 4-like [Talpa occidentalis]